MRTLIRNVAINAFALSLLPTILPGVKISGGLPILLIGGLLLTVMFALLRPIFTILFLPLHIVTFGLFAFLVNVPIFYILTVLVLQIEIKAFVFQGLNLAGFIIPQIGFNGFFAFVAASIIFSGIIHGIEWIMHK